VRGETKALSGAIGHIYDAAIDPDIWPSALASICELTRSAAGTINYHDMSRGTALLAHEHGTDPYFSRLYLERYADKNPLVSGTAMSAIGDPKRIGDLIPYDAFRDSVLYREWCAPQGYEDLLAACIYRDATRVGALAVTRGTEVGLYTAADVDLFAVISSHVCRALTISNHLSLRKADAQTFGSIVDQLSAAVMLIDPAGWLLYQNEAASRFLADHDVGRVVNQKLTLDGVDMKDLARGIARRRFYETSLSVGPDERAIKIAAVAVGTGGPSPSSPIAIFLTGLPGATKPSKTFLKSAYGLTAAEMRVVFGLLDGSSAADIARGARLSVATVRSHIASVREKTGARTQTDLVRLLAAAASPVRPG
jgi:DNA-binding CsgD family transcriptional regulator